MWEMGKKQEGEASLFAPATGFSLSPIDVGRTGFPEPEHSMNVTVISAKAGIPLCEINDGGTMSCHPRESGDPCMESLCSSPSA